MSGQLSSVCTSTSCPLASSAQCAAKRKLQQALQRYFEFPGFRPGQLDAMLPALHGRDVFVRMATGAGKSLCIFLPPLAVNDSAIGVVISPLNGLMDQQVGSEIWGKDSFCFNLSLNCCVGEAVR